MGDVGDYYRDLKPFIKERRRRARDGAYERIKAFFVRNGVELEDGNNTLIFRTPRAPFVTTHPARKCSTKISGKNAVRPTA